MLVEPQFTGVSQGDAFFAHAPYAPGGGDVRLEIGLVNNMPDSALLSTERQFCGLLRSGAGNRLDVRVHFLSLGGVARGPEAAAHMRGRYVDASCVADMALDALIVTGAEPRAKSLRDEPYWTHFARLMEWAERNTVSTLFSCLAAHAAVLHFDGVERHPVGFKRCGVFGCESRSDHPLLRDAPKGLVTPHSRYNELREDELRQAGYEILTHSPVAGVDAFVKTMRKSVFLLLQGHPEYDGDSLMREYRRDVLRFLKRERDDYPILPHDYFAPALARELSRFEQQMKSGRDADLARDFIEKNLPASGEDASAPRWRPSAALIYRNWLHQIAEAKRRANVEWALTEAW